MDPYEHQPAAPDVSDVEAIDHGQPAPTFYRLDGSKISLTECRWGAGAVLAAPMWLLARLIGQNTPGSTDDPAVEHLWPFEVGVEQAPLGAVPQVAIMVAEMRALGFGEPVYHVINDARQRTLTVLATCSHPSLPIIGRAHARAWSLRTPPKIKAFAELITPYADRTFLWSLSGAHDMLAPASCTIVRLPTAGTKELLDAHRQAMTAAGNRAAVPCATRDQMLAVVEDLHVVVRDFHLDRGVFVHQSDADMRAQRQAAGFGAADDPAGQSKFPSVMAELIRLDQKRSTGGGLILVLSLLAFIAIGFRGMSLARLLTIIPILFFHEFGHFAAMKVFGYRDLKMFFIPGFGAAVSGKRTDPAGWKQAVVSIMGPLPGIVVGIALGVYAIVARKPGVIDVASLLLAINCFNLIPILPFDGGRLLHAVVFSRLASLDVVFRLFAALGVLGLTVVFKSPILIAVGVPMLLALPQTARNAKAVATLRRQGAGAETIPPGPITPELADRIIPLVQPPPGKPQAARLVAMHTQEVFELLRTRPPGWFASIALLGTYAATIVAPLVVWLILVMVQDGSFDRLRRADMRPPEHAIGTPVPPLTFGGGAGAAVPREQISTITATFDNPASAKLACTELPGKLGKSQSASLVGDTLFIRVPGGEAPEVARWSDWAKAKTPNVFVQSKAMSASFRIQAIALSAEQADEIHAQLEDYFRLPLQAGLRAPWSPRGPITPEQRLARRTYRKLYEAEMDAWDDPDVRALREESLAAIKAKNMSKYTELAEKENRQRRVVADKKVRALLEGLPGTVDADMVNRYLRTHRNSPALNNSMEFDPELPPMLGTSREQSGQDDPTRALFGRAASLGKLVNIPWVEFDDSAEGLTALVDWLAAAGCTDVHYDVTGSSDDEEPEDPKDAEAAKPEPNGTGAAAPGGKDAK